MTVVQNVYNETDKFPRDEVYGLASQIQRAAVAIPSNIAEGYWRSHKKEYKQFLSFALGSAAELETQILLCKSIKKFSSIDFSRIEPDLEAVMKMLFVMIRRLSSE